jgi:hypothetical protein
MAFTMLINGDPDASVAVTVGFAVFALAFAALAATQYRRLFQRAANGSAATAGQERR